MITVNGRFLTQQITGTQRYAREVTRCLLSTRDKDSVQVLMPRYKGHLPEEFAAVTTELGRLRGHAWEQLELGYAANRSGGVLWSPANAGPLVAKQHVITIHDLSVLRSPEWVSKRYHLWYSFLLPRAASSARHVVTVSEYSKATIVEMLGVPEEKVSVAYLAADSRFAAAGQEEIALLRKKYKLPRSFVLTLGSLEPRKNLQRVVTAWSNLDKKSQPPLVVAGGLGPQRVFGNHGVDALHRQEDVVLLGYVPEDDLPALYSAATMFVYVSLFEGFGLPPLEAMACGTPVVASSTTSLPEVVGDAALTVDPYDEEAITDAMQRLLYEPGLRARMRARGLRRSRRFSWLKTSEEVTRILEKAHQEPAKNRRVNNL